MNKLNECPFCGCLPVEEIRNGRKALIHPDMDCPAGGMQEIASWNTRPIESALRAENDNLSNDNRMLSERVQRLVDGVKSRDAENERLRDALRKIYNTEIGTDDGSVWWSLLSGFQDAAQEALNER